MKKSVATRIKVTKTGKLLRRPMAVGHNRSKKTSKQLQEKRKKFPLKENYFKEVKKLLTS